MFSSQAMFDGYRLTGDGVTDCEREIVVDHETQLRDVCVGTGAIRAKRKLRKELCCILGGNRSVAKISVRPIALEAETYKHCGIDHLFWWELARGVFRIKLLTISFDLATKPPKCLSFLTRCYSLVSVLVRRKKFQKYHSVLFWTNHARTFIVRILSPTWYHLNKNTLTRHPFRLAGVTFF